MPSPSPSSRRSSSSFGARNISGSSRADPFVPRGLQQTFHIASSNSAASRALNDFINDHKENSSENSNGRGGLGRSNQNLKASSKKPWVTHFAKPATTLSPSKRVLAERNSSCSPVRLGPVASGDGETLSDIKLARPITPRGREDAPTTPGPVKGVAELSKRIQQFLEDQDVLLGVKTSSSHEVTPACPSVTPADQRPASSPYNPYNSPFFERPKFLRLNGNVSPLEAGADTLAASVDGIDTLMEPTSEELPLFEGEQVLETTLQQIHFCTNLSPSSIEDEELKPAEPAKDQILEEVAIKEAGLHALKVNALPILPGEERCLHDSEPEVRNEEQGSAPNVDDANRTVQDQEDGDMARQAENQKEKVCVTDVQVKQDSVYSYPQEGSQLYHENAQVLCLNPVEIEEEEDIVDGGGGVSWGKNAFRIIACGAFLATLVFLVLLSSAGPGLLPQSLVSNPVNSFWNSSKSHEHSMTLLRGMDGLWSTEEKYLPADARVVALKAAELYHIIRKQSTQACQQLQLYFHIACSILDDFRRALVQQISLFMNHETAAEDEDRARQFEWIQEYEFEGEWGDESTKLDYTNWELLHEYDLGAANQFVLGSIPESLQTDLRKNYSRLSKSPEVRDLLEDLMKLKGGNTEEDRLEVLQYFWEYRMFSASAHEGLRKSHFEISVEDDVTIEGFSSVSEHPDVKMMHTDHSEGQNTTDCTGQIEAKHFQTHTEAPPVMFEHAQVEARLDDLAEHPLEKAKMEQEQIFPETNDTASVLQESVIYEHAKTLNAQLSGLLDEAGKHIPSTARIEQKQVVPKMSKAPSEMIQGSMVLENYQTGYENEAAQMDSVHELQSEVVNVDTSSRYVNPDIAQLATLATFIIVSFFVFSLKKQRKNGTKIITNASNIQFLRKFDQPADNLDGEAQQNRQFFAEMTRDKKDMTMIEQLNERFSSVLQSPDPCKPRSPHARKDEDLIRSPVPTTSVTSPYGSFTTYKLMSKKEGQAMEAKLTPVRRSSRIRNHVTMSPNSNSNGAKRIAISPP